MRLPFLILTTALMLGANLVGAVPAAAAPLAPVITSSSASVGPPRVLPDSECSEGNTACGLFAVTVTFGRVDALPVGEFSAGLFGQAHVIRVFGCVAADGTRLGDRDVVVEQDNRLATRRGMPLSRAPGQSSITGTVYDLFDNGPTPDCPTGSSAALLSISVSSVTLQLSTFGENATTFDYTVPGSWGWAGAVTGAAPPPITAGPLRLDGASVNVVPPASAGTAAGCPAVNGCGRIELFGVPYRPGDRSTLLRGALKASGTLVRTYGCVTPAGRRLHRYDTRVVEPAAFNGGPGKVFTLVAGRDATQVTLVAALDDSQPGNCPSGTRAVLFRIAVKKVAITLVAFTNPEQRTTRSIPDRWHWAGVIPTGSIS
jgi:hypothetical protein